jgi:hypothetical protein
MIVPRVQVCFNSLKNLKEVQREKQPNNTELIEGSNTDEQEKVRW